MGIRQKTEERVFAFLEQHQMIRPHDHIVAGVSGGADSVCLLFILLEYAGKIPFKLSVVHVNHGLRPDAAQDAGYVRELCGRYGLPFFLVEADVKGCAERAKCSPEDAGRRLRYEAFHRISEEVGANKIAVAHNCNDRAETMLFHLFRGSGLKGLCGIRPVRQEIIRPLLCLERREIEDYLTEREIPWRTDSTNGTDEYARNRIRRHVLPYVERELARGCVGHMARTADILTETEEYMQQQTQAARTSCVKEAGGSLELSVEGFKKLHPAIQKRLLHLLAEELSPTGKDILAVHVAEVNSLFEGTGNRRVDLPMGISAVRSYGKVILGKNPGKKQKTEEEPFCLSVSKEQLTEEGLVIPLGGQGILKLTVLCGRQYKEVPGNQYTKWFDYDKIKKLMHVRNREIGDFLSISDGQGAVRHKSLKEYMIGEKIPKEDRDGILLLAEEHHVLWIIGGRMSEYYKVDGNTERILQVQLSRQQNGG